LTSGRSLDVALTDQGAGGWLADFPHVTVSAEVGRRRAAQASGAGPAAQGVQRILAPMPGRVVRLLVQVGDEVAARQGLIVVEAMKMENELKSPKAGRVREIGVVEGASVESGRLLVVVE
jgi:biotin carboxyl carrier protein